MPVHRGGNAGRRQGDRCPPQARQPPTAEATSSSRTSARPCRSVSRTPTGLNDDKRLTSFRSLFPQHCRRLDVLWQFDEKDPDDPPTVRAAAGDHKMTEPKTPGMLEITTTRRLDTRMSRGSTTVATSGCEDRGSIDRANRPRTEERKCRRVHPLGRNIGADAADPGAGRAQPAETGRRGGRVQGVRDILQL